MVHSIILIIAAYDVSSLALYLWLYLLINNKQIILSYTLLLLYDEIFQNIDCKLFLPLCLTWSLSISIYKYFSSRSGRECTQFENISIRWGYEFKTGHIGRIEEIVCPGVLWVCTSKRYVREFIIYPSGLLLNLDASVPL